MTLNRPPILFSSHIRSQSQILEVPASDLFGRLPDIQGLADLLVYEHPLVGADVRALSLTGGLDAIA